MQKRKQIVIGLGEVGSALANVIECIGYDKKEGIVHHGFKVDVAHICFPFSDDFVSSVERYIQLFNPSLVIVHSSVPIGTCDSHGWVHSPIRGVHPNLELGIRTFVKFFGGEKASLAAQIFEEEGIPVKIVARARDTEALKLWDTTQYGVMILLEKAIKVFCDDHGVDFDFVYAQGNQTYNEGYTALGRSEVVRPYLKHIDGPIGGHCVIPNAEIITKFHPPYPTLVSEILEVNKILEKLDQK